MNHASLQWVIAYGFILGFLLIILCAVLLRITLTRRLKGHLQARNEYWGDWTIDFGLFNTFVFAWACVIPSYTSWKNFKRYFHENLDVRSFANRFEMIIAHTLIFGFALLMLSFLGFGITKVFGIIDWQ